MADTDKKRGRPRKNGARRPIDLARAVIALAAFEEARERGEKHSVAIKEAAEAVRLRGLPISETEVRRILKEFRPRGGMALEVTERILEGDAAKRFRSLLEQVPGFVKYLESKGLSEQDHQRPLRGFILRFAPRVEYPRCNAKNNAASSH